MRCQFFLRHDFEMCARAKLVINELMYENKMLERENKELMKEIQKLIDRDDEVKKIDGRVKKIQMHVYYVVF